MALQYNLELSLKYLKYMVYLYETKLSINVTYCLET